MINYTDDKSGLIDKDGNVWYPFSSEEFSKLEVIRQAQLTAIDNNNAARHAYFDSLSIAQTSISAGRGGNIVSSVKPLAEVVDDEGNRSFVPFSPPLPDLIPLSPAPNLSPNGISTTNIPKDRTDQILEQNGNILKMLGLIWNKLNNK